MSEWKVKKKPNEDGYRVMNKKQTIAYCPIGLFERKKAKNNAELICNVKNSHDKLVEALKEINNILPKKPTLPISYQIREVIEQVLKEVNGD